MPNPFTINDAPDLTNKSVKKVFIKGSKNMARLTYEQRKKLPAKSFVFPGKKGSEKKGHEGGPAGRGAYPIPDAAHARNALARVSRFGTSSEKARVRTAVHKKFPSIEIYEKPLKS